MGVDVSDIEKQVVALRRMIKRLETTGGAQKSPLIKKARTQCEIVKAMQNLLEVEMESRAIFRPQMLVDLQTKPIQNVFSNFARAQKKLEQKYSVSASATFLKEHGFSVT
jgi:hypothetical protein